MPHPARPSPFSKDDWLFGELNPRELRACFLWECARDLPYINNWNDRTWAAPSEKRAALDFLQSKLKGLGTAEFTKYFPGKYLAINALQFAGIVQSQGRCPWGRLSEGDRENLINLTSPPALNVQPLRGQGVVNSVGGNLLRLWDEMGTQPSLGEHHDPHAGFIIIELTPYTWTGFTKEEILRQFTQMLEKETWAPNPPARRWLENKGFSHANTRTLLDELGVMRLMHAYPLGEAARILSEQAGINKRIPDAQNKDRRSVFAQLLGQGGEIASPGIWQKHHRSILAKYLKIFGEQPVSALQAAGWPTRKRLKKTNP